MSSPSKISLKSFTENYHEVNYDQFVSGDTMEIKIKVLSAQTEILKHVLYKIEIKSSFFQTFYSYKRYSEFQALYEALKIKYQNIQLPSFPSRFQFINKINSRIVGFQQLLTRILEIANQDLSLKTGILKILFAFLTKKTSNTYFQQETILNQSFISQSSMKDLNDGLGNVFQSTKDILKKHSFNLDTARKISNMDEDNEDFLLKNTLEMKPKKDVESESEIIRKRIQSEELIKDNNKQITNNEKDETQDLKKQKKQKKFYHLMDKIYETFSEFNTPNKSRTDSIDTLYEEIEDDSIIKSVDYQNFDKYILIKFPLTNIWLTFYAKISGSNILLFESMGENHFDVIISIFNAGLELIKQKENYIIEISHKYDREKMIITMANKSKNEKIILDKKTHEKEIKELFWQLKRASQNSLDLNLKDIPFKTIGKIYFEICEGYNFFGLEENSTVMIRINHKPYIMETMKVISKEKPEWNQKFMIPITNYYFDIFFEIINIYNDGWISESIKEETFGFCTINMADILSKFSRKERKVILAIDLSEHQKEKDVKRPEKPTLFIKFQNLSNFSTCFAPQLENYIEGTRIDVENVDKKELKINFNRFKRISSIFYLNFYECDAIINFKYPRFSYLCWSIIMLFLCFFDMNHIWNYLLILMFILMTYYSPYCKDSFDTFFFNYFFNENLLNKNFIEPKIETIDQAENKKFADINRFKGKLKSTKRTMIDKFKLMRKSLANLQIYITYVCNLMEKVTNLIVWNEPQKTLNFYLFVFLSFFFTVNFPFRYFFMIAVCYKFLEGRNMVKNKFLKNSKICLLVIDHIFKQHFQDQIHYVKNSKEAFPLNPHFNSLKKKLCQKLREILNLNINENFANECICIRDLIFLISTCKRTLKVNKNYKDIGLWQMLSKHKIPKNQPLAKIFKKILNYIYNIPSDYFRILHPKKIII